MSTDLIKGIWVSLSKKKIIGFLVFSLLFIFPLQTAALAEETSIPLYLERDGQAVVLSSKIDGASLSDPDHLLNIRRAVACVEVDPQIVTLVGRGTDTPTLSITPEFPDCTNSAELAQKVADIVSMSLERDGFDRQIRYIATAVRTAAEYDTEGVRKGILADNRCAYGALINGLATCEGYANAFLLICTEAGIPCVRVLGYHNGVYHTWNAVCDGSSWYMCDLTESGFLLLSEENFSKKPCFSDIDWDAYTAAKAYCLSGRLSLNP